LPRNRAGDRIQAVFEIRNPRIEAIAIAIEGFDGGGQPPRLTLALPCYLFDQLRLLCEIARCHQIAPHSH
jgi:hypothetical protein